MKCACGFENSIDQLMFNRERLTIHCHACGAVLEDTEQTKLEELEQLGKKNRMILHGFSVIEDSTLNVDDQYFLIYGLKEGDQFSPERVVGVYGASEVARTMAWYRETGVLQYPVPRYTPDSPKHASVNAKWVYVCKAEHYLGKIEGFNEVRMA